SVMAKEPVVIRAENGQTSAGQAEIVRFSNASRITKSTLWVIAGLFGGTVCIIVPVVHLVTTWGFPLLGILMAIRTMKRDVSRHDPEGVCPAWGQPAEFAGGPLIDTEWQACPHCQAKLRFDVVDTPIAGSQPPAEPIAGQS